MYKNRQWWLDIESTLSNEEVDETINNIENVG